VVTASSGEVQVASGVASGSRGERARLAARMAGLRLSSQKEAGARYARYVDDPVGFVREVLGEELWSKQREIAESVRDHRHVAVRSAHDTGKSFVASRLAAWWLSVHAPGDAFVVTTAPTFAQVRAILWREINRAHRKGKLVGRVNQTEWWIDKEIVAYGRKPADYDEDSFQGIHARYVLVILDEACGIPGSLWTAAETIATNDGCRVLAIGNPDTPLSQFKRACEPGSGWRVIHVDGLQSPNFTGESVPESLRALLLSPTWVEERRADWGEDSALFQSKVRGEFPAVPQGQVYRELGPHLQWYGELPRFSKVVGGLDFGGANDEAHMTAGVVAGLVASVGSTDDRGVTWQRVSEVAQASEETETPRQVGRAGALVRFAHFEDAGPRVHSDLLDWMRSWEARLGHRIEWRADKSQSFGISMARQQGFQVEPSHGGADSVWNGIGLQRRRMADGASFFTEELMRAPVRPDGTPAKGRAWYERMAGYRWAEQPNEERAVPGVPVKRNDDTADADRYLHEAVDGFPSASGSPVSRKTLGGRRRAKHAV
jgi:hypothetical protein